MQIYNASKDTSNQPSAIQEFTKRAIQKSKRLSKKSYFLISAVFTVLLMLAIWYLYSSQATPEVSLHHQATEDQLSDCEALAKRYCSGCHTFPEAELLDKSTWRTQPLPAMGSHLGIFEFAGEEYQRDFTIHKLPRMDDGLQWTWPTGRAMVLMISY